MPRWALFIIIQVAVIGLDRASKLVARRYLEGTGRHSFAGDLFRLEYSENTGAFLSLGSGLAPEMRFLVITGLSGLLLLGLAVLLATSKDLAQLEFVLLSLILAGGTSNLIDRMFNDGRVIDFMNMGIGSLRTGIFNVADMAITGGVIAAILLLFRRGRRHTEQVAEAASEP
ncbi:MAG: signal peptidase II [Armatimonadetes bacterium]|nr:signal peptidase II [Armatimonadota bacterium]